MQVNDNVRRGLRTGLQALLGIAATGGLTKVWESFNGTHSVDATVQVAVGILLIAFAGWAQNTLEDVTGTGVLKPEDTKIGQDVLAAERTVGAARA